MLGYDKAPILVVDDDKLVRLKLKQILESETGTPVVLAEDGLEAWDILQENPDIQLIISDWMMPGMTGPELCDRIRNAEGRPYTYFILATAKESDEDLARGMDSGANDYIKKPVSNLELVARVQAGLRILKLEKSLKHRSDELERGLSAAGQVQLGTLPAQGHLNAIRGQTGLNIAFNYQASEDLGGDLLGVAVPEPGIVAVFLGDVSGHGVSSALSAVSLNNYIQTCLRATYDPVEIIKLANEYCANTFPSGKYATLVYLYVNVKDCSVSAILAGHPPLLQVGNNGDVIKHSTTIAGVGLWPDPPDASDVMTFQLNPGNRLVVYTDGITEARNPQGDFFAEESLVRTVLAQRSTELNQLPENVFKDVRAWCGPNNKPDDDTTLVAMEIEPRDQ